MIFATVEISRVGILARKLNFQKSTLLTFVKNNNCSLAILSPPKFLYKSKGKSHKDKELLRREYTFWQDFVAHKLKKGKNYE